MGFLGRCGVRRRNGSSEQAHLSLPVRFPVPTAQRSLGDDQAERRPGEREQQAFGERVTSVEESW